MDTVGNRIRLAMEQAGMKQYELAKEMGKAQGTVNMWLTGKRGLSMDDVPKLCETLGISPNYLFGYENKVPKKTIGAKMKEILKKNHILQKDAAQMLGITPGEMSHWFVGRANIKAEDIEKFCEVFHTTPNYLMGYSEEK